MFSWGLEYCAANAMAVELCSESGGGVVISSPRISFSHDFCHSDSIPVEQHPLRSGSSGLKSSSVDFDFCVGCESFDQESSSADELFSGGKILPGEIKKKNSLTKQLDPFLSSASHNPPLSLPPPSRNAKSNKKDNNKERCTKDSAHDEADEKACSKSFWGFKRSSSCGSAYRRSLCPLPPLLSRSNSTGSTPTVKGAALTTKEGHSHNSTKQSSLKCGSSTKSSQYLGSAGNYQKPPLKKGYGAAYANGVSVRVNPVLNVPSANLFGLSNIFSSSKDKRKK